MEEAVVGGQTMGTGATLCKLCLHGLILPSFSMHMLTIQEFIRELTLELDRFCTTGCRLKMANGTSLRRKCWKKKKPCWQNWRIVYFLEKKSSRKHIIRYERPMVWAEYQKLGRSMIKVGNALLGKWRHLWRKGWKMILSHIISADRKNQVDKLLLFYRFLAIPVVANES